MMNPHSQSESARLIAELKAEIAKDQTEITLETPKLRRIEQEIAKEEAELAKKKQELDRKKVEGLHEHQHIDQLKADLAHSQREFADLGRQIQQMGFGKAA